MARTKRTAQQAEIKDEYKHYKNRFNLILDAACTRKRNFPINKSNRSSWAHAQILRVTGGVRRGDMSPFLERLIKGLVGLYKRYLKGRSKERLALMREINDGFVSEDEDYAIGNVDEEELEGLETMLEELEKKGGMSPPVSGPKGGSNGEGGEEMGGEESRSESGGDGEEEAMGGEESSSESGSDGGEEEEEEEELGQGGTGVGPLGSEGNPYTFDD